MSKIVADVLAANRAYAARFGDKGTLPMPPARQFAILTCMDARLDPAQFAGLAEGDAQTHCGMETFTDEVMCGLLAQSLTPAVLDASGWHDIGPGPGSTEAMFIDWLTIRDQVESVCADVRRLRTHPLVPRVIPIYGYIYDVQTGQLVDVPEATRLGTAT